MKIFNFLNCDGFFRYCREAGFFATEPFRKITAFPGCRKGYNRGLVPAARMADAPVEGLNKYLLYIYINLLTHSEALMDVSFLWVIKTGSVAKI